MEKRYRRTIAYILICVLGCVTLSGCSLVPSLQLTEEQSNLIAEYAAGKLLEYSKGHPGGLMILEDVDRADVNPGMQKPEEEKSELPPLPSTEQPPMPADEDLSDPGQDVQPEGVQPDDMQPEDVQPEQEALVEAPEDISEVPSESIAEALGVAGADITYDRYEIVSTYPPEESQLAFTMKAAPGKDLLVVHFNLTNPGSEDIDAYTDSSGFKVRLMLNGSSKLRGDVTFLDNDLMNYRGLLTPGSLVDAVLVFEVEQGTEVNSMDLLVLDDNGENRYTLM